jgi:PilZ domain
LPSDARAWKGGDLMSPPITDQLGERRAEPRRFCHQHCLVRYDRLHLDGQQGRVGAEGYVSDLSAGGVGLLLRPALPSGTTLAIDPLESTAAPLPPARVVRCVPAGGRWRHGCRLERRLSEDELRAWLT